MNKEKLSKTISLLMHQNLCVVNNGTKENPDFVVGGTELLNKELTKLFSLHRRELLKGFFDWYMDTYCGYDFSKINLNYDLDDYLKTL